MCITNIEEGESCDTSSPAKYPTKLCGPGLECIAKIPYKPETAVCTRNAARKCINETLQYEADQVAGTLGPGRYKPNCDEYGKYAPRQCTPGSTCYCVNENGERLFGEGSVSDQDMINCECSVYWENTISKGLELGMRCLPNGNFDPLQCFDNHCFCYDLSTSSVQSGPFSIDMLIFMSCYNSTIHKKTTNACQRCGSMGHQGLKFFYIIEAH
nr:saxiphilin-like [Cherax quadricarinatus]